VRGHVAAVQTSLAGAALRHRSFRSERTGSQTQGCAGDEIANLTWERGARFNGRWGRNRTAGPGRQEIGRQADITKTVEDLYEAMVGSVPGVRFGIGRMPEAANIANLTGK
jgi:hypothetical protein